MRTIKFRGKRIDTGKFAYGDLIHRNDGDVAIYTNLDTWVENQDDVDAYGDSFIVANSTVGQFTGLSDKKGREIYEGDIVRAMMDYGLSGMIESIVEIYWDTFHGWQFEYFDIYSIEVIGNIYDNPELLKQQEL